MSYFDGIKVGDRVYSVVRGWGEVVRIDNDAYPLAVMFDNRIYDCFSRAGCSFVSQYQTLFWDDPHIIPPAKPKRKVKKTVEGWANVYPARHTCIWNTKELADANAAPERIACVHVAGEYEVEE